MIKVFLVDNHPVMRQGLASVLEKNEGFEVVGGADNAQDALSQIGELKPDIVIMDAFRGGGDYSKDVAMIQQKYDKAKIFVLTDSTRESDFINAIGAGVKGYLSKSSEVPQLIDAIRLVASEGAIVYSSALAKLFDSTLRDTNRRLDQLSQREKEILTLVSRGYGNKEIASRCYVSEATVKAHLRRIAEKLDVKNRAEAVATAINKGLIDITPNSPTG